MVKNKMNETYKPKHILFRALNEIEVKQFKEYTYKFCKDGFSINQLSTVHPIIRKELIRQLEQSLREQGEL